MYTYVIVVGTSATKRSTEILKRGGLFLVKTNEKLDLLLRVNNLSDPDIEDIRVVRAIGKKRANLYPFRPYDIYIESLEYRQYRKIFQNSVEPRTWLDEPARVSLTSKSRKLF